MDDPKVGAAVGIPLMRVEEMYMIQAEALEHVSPGQGLAKLQDFMKHTVMAPTALSRVTTLKR